ncbi:MAG: recombination protein O N-terminal domain-containing protein [Paludibacteraceae bacterium]|nr:recombination protein O N-terminal domain-containing protein [Paludibacteraceae bacterium]
MVSTTEAIVLSLQPRSDKAHVLHAYTRAGGRVNYMVYGLGRKHAIGLYTPFTLLSITADYPVGSKPPTLKEATPLVPVTTGSQSDYYRQAMALFLSEVLYLTLRYPVPDEPMFAFLSQAVRTLDDSPNFHIHFLIGFAAQLGFAIDETEQPQLLRLPQSRSERQEQLRRLCAYFSEHIDDWTEPRSLAVLMEVFD